MGRRSKSDSRRTARKTRTSHHEVRRLWQLKLAEMDVQSRAIYEAGDDDEQSPPDGGQHDDATE